MTLLYNASLSRSTRHIEDSTTVRSPLNLITELVSSTHNFPVRMYQFFSCNADIIFLAKVIDLLREENAKLMGENTVLIIKIVKLEQTVKEKDKLMARISQNDKEKSNLIVLQSEDTSESKLDDDILGIRQSSIQNISTGMENSNDTPKQIEFLHSENDASASNISDDSSNSDVQKVTKSQISGSLIRAEWAEPRVFDSSISPEDKEIIEFLESQDKERVSDMIRKRNREKKLQARDSSLDNNSPDQSNLSCDIKTIPLEEDDQIHVVTSSLRETESSFLETEKEKYQEISVTNPDDRQKEKYQESEPTNHNIYVTEELDEIEPTKRQYIEQGLIKELLSSNPIVPPVSSEIIEDQIFQITTQSLIRLFHYAIRFRHEEILAWYYYSDDFENKVIEICRELGVTDKTARTQLYNKMLNHLPGITSENLRMKTLRAKKIQMLFGKDGVGKDKIRQVSYSTNAISSLTNSQIQNVIKNVTSAKPLLETITNSDDQTIAEASISIEFISTVSKKSPEAEVSTSNKSRPPISVLLEDPEEKRKRVIEMILERFSYLSLKYSDKYGDNFDCPDIYLVCDKEHKRDNVQGQWGDGDYCGEITYRLICWRDVQKGIPIVTVKA
ncbi:hypothetical protein Glove_46g14 [Diversispora epigaea]|uniref:Uncharacterized protein n=1 Tax=Diversispora epigaea TaxID=1348612 RepID=A0A397JIW4_9GLOM|nr:hypothetical protein Glove_46g14 [Diversispora epigaea]